MRFTITTTDVLLLLEAVEKWGLQSQVYKALEELAELSQVLARSLLDGTPALSDMVDEIADVYIMLHSLGCGFGINEAVDKRVDYKMERLLTLVI